MKINYNLLQEMQTGTSKLSELEIDGNLEMNTYSISSPKIQGNLDASIQLNQTSLMNNSRTKINPSLYDSGGSSSSSIDFSRVRYCTYEGVIENTTSSALEGSEVLQCKVTQTGYTNYPQYYYYKEYRPGTLAEGEAYLATYTNVTDPEPAFVTNITAYTIPSQIMIQGMAYPIREVKPYSFYGTSSMSSEEYLVKGCPKLQILLLSEGIQFYNLLNPCPNLQAIYFPNSLEGIGEHVFENVSTNCSLYMSQYLFEKISLLYPSRMDTEVTGEYFDGVPIIIWENSNV